MKTLESRKIIRELSKKYGVSETEIKLIISSPFEFIISTIRSEVNREKKYYPSFRVINFGRFFVPDNVAEYVYQKIVNKKGKEET